MGCQKGTSLVKEKDAKFTCDKCAARVQKKSQVCKPVKLKAKGKKNQSK
jgi:hypothetical protein